MNHVGHLAEVSKVAQPMGPRLKVARDNANLSQEQLAGRVGVMVRSVKAWESGKSVPRANRLQMLAGILGVSLSWLLEGREDGFMESQNAGPEAAMQKELERLNAALDEARSLAARSQAFCGSTMSAPSRTAWVAPLHTFVA